MKPINLAIIAAAFLSAVWTSAGREIYFAEDVSLHTPISQGGPNNVPVPVYTNSQFKAAQFLRRLPGVATASFEGFATGSSPTNIYFGTNCAVFAGTRIVRSMLDPTNTIGGGFATTGTNFIHLDATGGGDLVFFTVTFSAPQAAFGFYGMDVEYNQFAVKLYHTNGSTSTIPVPVTVPQGSGGVFYFGVIDRDEPFTAVQFQNIGSNTEAFDFDDLTIAVPEIVIPPRLDIRVSQVELCWDTVSNRVYRLQYRSELTTNSWLPLGDPIFGDGSRFCTNDAVLPGQPRRFYQLVITDSP